MVAILRLIPKKIIETYSTNHPNHPFILMSIWIYWFQVLGLVEDAHPDALASRCLVTLAILRSGCPLPWDHRQEFAWYV